MTIQDLIKELVEWPMEWDVMIRREDKLVLIGSVARTEYEREAVELTEALQ